MVEHYPDLRDKSLNKWITGLLDFIGLYYYDLDVLKIYLIEEDKLKYLGSHTPKLNLTLDIDGFKMDMSQWYDITPVFKFYTYDYDEYARLLARLYGDKITNKLLLVSYSGGKDSTAALLILDKLYEYVNFKYKVAYVHMPYLEDTRNINFIESIGSKLGINIDILQPPKHLVKRYLVKYGLPFRRNRWCTYLKVKTLKKYMKSINAIYQVIGDRLSECRKRFSRLSERVIKLKLFHRRLFMINGLLTLFDIIRLCREYNIIHPDYLSGCTRVSCFLCPYKGLHELNKSCILEDEEFIEDVLRKEYKRWYSKYISYDDFKRYHLWRYTPSIARVFSRLHQIYNEIEPSIDLNDIITGLSSIWRRDLPDLPRVNILDYLKIIPGIKNLIVVDFRYLSNLT